MACNPLTRNRLGGGVQARRASGVQRGSSSEVVSHRGLSSRQLMELRHSRMKYLPDPITAGLDNDLTLPIGPMEPVLARLDPLLATPLELRPDEFHGLVAFVRDGLL